jgi:hypothetical protein
MRRLAFNNKVALSFPSSLRVSVENDAKRHASGTKSQMNRAQHEPYPGQQQQGIQVQHHVAQMPSHAPSAPPRTASPFDTAFVTNAYAIPQHYGNGVQQQQQQMQSGHRSSVSGSFGAIDIEDTVYMTEGGTKMVKSALINLDCVPDPKDKAVINKINQSVMSLKDMVPRMEKNIADIGNSYRVQFVWEDETWTFDAKSVNEKILSIGRVANVHYGNLELCVLVEKSDRTEGNRLLRSNVEAAFGNALDPKDPILSVLYVPSSPKEARMQEFIANEHPSAPSAQKGAIFTAMRNALIEAKANRREELSKGGDKVNKSEKKRRKNNKEKNKRKKGW